ncbi:MAG: hypothetical protein H0X45_14335, partial [Planctomycetes bacterium]|nr:hypothetical protein [Planctomycetota bacterium]
LIEVDDDCLGELKRAAQTLAQLHQQAATALATLHARHAAQRPVDTAHARAYASADADAVPGETAPRFLDQRR